jgi:hypothetical protein
MKEEKLAKSDAALRGIREALERNNPAFRRFHPEWNGWLQANVAKRERAKFKRFVLTVWHLGDVDLKKAARRVGVSKELLDKWMNTPKISRWVNGSLSDARQLRARLVVDWAKSGLKIGLTLKAPLGARGEIQPDGMDYGNMLSLAKQAALVFESPKLFRVLVDTVLIFHGGGGLSSAKQFFIDLGKCLSHGRHGTRGIKPAWPDKLDIDIADIILSHDPPMSHKDAVHELRKRGHLLPGHLPTLEVRFRKRKHRLIHDAHVVCMRFRSSHNSRRDKFPAVSVTDNRG